ncbi:MAG: phage integrase N-terminal SAM-like domain-containing protein [Candidatus Woesearchaeota archaeon]
MDVSELVRKEGLRRGLSSKTIKTYRDCLKLFFKWLKDPLKVKKRDVKDYLDMLIEKKGALGNTINVNLCAIKFLYEKYIKKNKWARPDYHKIFAKNFIKSMLVGHS